MVRFPVLNSLNLNKSARCQASAVDWANRTAGTDGLSGLPVLTCGDQPIALKASIISSLR